MNVIWLLIICITVLYCLCNGRVDVINAVFVSVGKETFDFVVPLLCVTAVSYTHLDVYKRQVKC